jgi:maleylpyruvate isomerase
MTLPKLKLYSYWRSSSSWRVRIVLAHKGLDYEYCAVDLSPAHKQQHDAAFAQLNPLQQVPVLEVGEGGDVFRLTQSVAIAEYLEERQPAPPLLPSDPLARARARQAVEIVGAGIQPLQNPATLDAVRELAGPDPAQAFAQRVIARGLGSLESHARAHGQGYSVGGELSLADVFLVPQLYNARRFGIALAAFPTLLAIEARVQELPAFLAAHPDRQPDAPTHGGQP